VTKGKVAAVRRERVGTGGGPQMEEDVDELESRVVGVMGEVCVSGIVGGFDTLDQLDSIFQSVDTETGMLLFSMYIVVKSPSSNNIWAYIVHIYFCSRHDQFERWIGLD